MKEKKITCIVCPRGCEITAAGDNGVVKQISGYCCPRGEVYGRSEYESPVRILTSTVLVEGGALVPVRTDRPIPKEKMGECMEQIKKLCVKPPVHRYDRVLCNVCKTKADLVATGEIG